MPDSVCRGSSFSDTTAARDLTPYGTRMKPTRPVLHLSPPRHAPIYTDYLTPTTNLLATPEARISYRSHPPHPDYNSPCGGPPPSRPYFSRSCTLQLRDLRHVAARHLIPICVTPPSRPYSSRPARCNSVTYDTWQLATLPPPTTPRPCMVNCEHMYPAQSSRAPDRGGGYTALVNHSPTISLHLQQ
jgi:hypothetical protein